MGDPVTVTAALKLRVRAAVAPAPSVPFTGCSVTELRAVGVAPPCGYEAFVSAINESTTHAS